MRFVLKVLAVLCVLFCGLLTVLSVVLVPGFFVSARVEALPLGGKVALFCTIIFILAAATFGLVSAVRHLRGADATTARQVSLIVVFLFGVYLVGLIHGRPDRSARIEWFGTRTETVGSIAAGLAMVALYQLVLKGLAARNYPPDPRLARRDENQAPPRGAADGPIS